MHNFNGGTMYRIKVIPLAIILILLSSFTHAQESEGLIQKAYKKYILKEKTVEKKPAPKPQTTSAARETVGEYANTVIVDSFYKNMSKAEIIQEIKGEVDSEEEILGQIPELKRQNDKDGKGIYSYLVEGKQVNLEDVDEKILRSLVAQVAAKVERLRTDAILEQQGQLKAIRDIGAVSRPPQAPSRSPAVPQRPPAPPRK
jgi:hypothetical protein